MYRLFYSYEKAYSLVKRQRSIVNPNKGFVIQLNYFDSLTYNEKELFCSPSVNKDLFLKIAEATYEP